MFRNLLVSIDARAEPRKSYSKSHTLDCIVSPWVWRGFDCVFLSWMEKNPKCGNNFYDVTLSVLGIIRILYLKLKENKEVYFLLWWWLFLIWNSELKLGYLIFMFYILKRIWEFQRVLLIYFGWINRIHSPPLKETNTKVKSYLARQHAALLSLAVVTLASGPGPWFPAEAFSGLSGSHSGISWTFFQVLKKCDR